LLLPDFKYEFIFKSKFMIKMSKVFRYFLFSTMALSVLFLASCDEDTELPLGDLAISTTPDTDQTVSPGDTIDVEVTISNAPVGTEATALSDAGGDFVDADNTAADGESVSYIVPGDAETGDIITLSFSVNDGSQQASTQLTLNVETTVVDIALSNSDFSTLVAALDKAGLVSTLQGTGPFTVFAPTNAAFDDLFTTLGVNGIEDLSAEALEPILLYHVVSASVLSTELTDGPVETVEGSNIFVDTQNGVQINTATVSTADLTAGNGVVHVVDEVLLPSYSLISSTAVLLGSQGNSTEGSFYNALDDEVLLYSAASQNSGVVDFLYYWGNTNNHSVTALDDSGAQAVFDASGVPIGGFDPKPATRFLATDVTAADFDAIGSAADLGDTFLTDQDFTATGVETLAVDDVFAIELDATRGGNIGLVKVTEVVGQGGTTGYIELDIKIIR
jgi:uncharacterized surface protein with fasciclin (FAS1) repeats